MSIDAHYEAPQLKLWQGRRDTPPGSSLFQYIKTLDLTKPLPDTHSAITFALLGYSCDEGIRRNLGRTGAAEGPDALRGMLAKLPLHRKDIAIFDAGNILCRDHDLESTQSALAEAVNILLQNNVTPIVIGGGHDMAWGHYQGIAKKLPSENLGIINFDAHFDMRPTLEGGRGTSGSPFLQIASAHEASKRELDYNCIGIQASGNTSHLYATAKRYHTHVMSAEEAHMQPAAATTFVQRVIDDNQHIYLSLCLDVFSAAYAPGVSAPQAFGLAPWDIIPLVRAAATSGKVISYDIAELSPQYDNDSRTIKLTANFVHEIIHHHQPA